MAWLSGFSRATLAWLAMLLAAVTLVAVNVLADQSVKRHRADLTAGKLFTITEATRQVLREIDEPVTIKLYFSEAITQRAPGLAQHAGRITDLLRHYADLSGGKLVFERIDPQPFSDAEDQAVSAGLQGLPLDQGQQIGYFGLTGANATDDLEVVPFFTLDRQDFLEYDLALIVHKLTDPKRKVVGLLSPLKLAGGMGPQGRQTPAWLIHDQLSAFFDVRALPVSLNAVPAEIDALLIIAPGRLAPETVYAIDQYALAGGPVIALLDPYSEVSQGMQAEQMGKDDPLHGLLAAWGVELEAGKFAGDGAYARQVQFSSGGQPEVASYLAWMNFDTRAFDTGSALFSNVERIVLASPGHLMPLAGAGPAFAPLIQTSDEAMLFDVATMRQPDPLKLLEIYKPGGERLTLAARLSGPAKTAFADGPPTVEGQNTAETGAARMGTPIETGEINVVVVADADMVFDSFWARAQDLFGQRVILPQANNADFVLNALENMTGAAALGGLRGRGVEQRPFTLVEDIRRRAEARFRARERELNANLSEAEQKLRDIQARAQDGNVILTASDKQAIAGFRQQVIAIRRDLREVQRALRADIERVDFAVKFINIAGVPLLLAAAGLVVGVSRARRRLPARDKGSKS